MDILGTFSSQIYKALSDVSHPLEGTFYLFLLAVVFRWRWPKAWNALLKKISARNPEQKSNQIDE